MTNKTNMEIAILWARVSTREQSEEGYSLDAQVKLLRDYALSNNLKVVKEFVTPESASSSQERKQFQKMIEYLKDHNNIKHLLCEKTDRLTRNFQDASTLDDCPTSFGSTQDDVFGNTGKEKDFIFQWLGLDVFAPGRTTENSKTD